MPHWLLTLAITAASPQARLAFSSESPACNEARLREAVATRLGYDPFVTDAPLAG